MCHSMRRLFYHGEENGLGGSGGRDAAARRIVPVYHCMWEVFDHSFFHFLLVLFILYGRSFFLDWDYVIGIAEGYLHFMEVS